MAPYNNAEERELVLTKVYKILDKFGIENRFSYRQAMIEAFEEGMNFKMENKTIDLGLNCFVCEKELINCDKSSTGFRCPVDGCDGNDLIMEGKLE